MELQLSRGVRAPVEQIYRALIKNHFLNDEPPKLASSCQGEFGRTLVLQPCLGEMGMEIRHHIARVEPWIRNGWKVVTRRPALYPAGAAIEAPGYFEQVDRIFVEYGALGSHGSIHVPPLEFGKLELERNFDGGKGAVTLSLSDITKVVKQSMAEIELRKLFLQWFYFDGRPITDLDRYSLSFDSAAVGNSEYYCSAAVRPGFLPPPFLAPPEPVPAHVGVQMRKMNQVSKEVRNSDPEMMMRLAEDVAAILGLKVLVYGHPGGCHIPPDAKCTWDRGRPDNHMARELGYLKSCRIMVSPDSGWADLMAWLRVPSLLERIYSPGAFEPLRAGFGGKLLCFDPNAPLGSQIDRLLSAEGDLLPPPPPVSPMATQLFPWEP